MMPQGLCSMDVMSPGSLKLALANCGDCYANLRNSRGTTGWCKVPIRYTKLKNSSNVSANGVMIHRGIHFSKLSKYTVSQEFSAENNV